MNESEYLQLTAEVNKSRVLKIRNTANAVNREGN
jgi:hypothetical protein